MSLILDELFKFVNSERSKKLFKLFNNEHRYSSISDDMDNYFFNKPFSDSFFTKIPRIFLSEFQTKPSLLKNVDFCMSREGFWGTYNFFKENKKPPSDFESKIIIPYIFSSIIPNEWINNCLLYQVKCLPSSNNIKNLYIVGSVNEVVFSEEYLDHLLSKVVFMIDKNTNINISLRQNHQEVFLRNYDNTEFIMRCVSILNEYLNKYTKVNYAMGIKDFVNKNLKPDSAFLELDENSQLVYDSYIYYKSTSDGAFPLIDTKSSIDIKKEKLDLIVTDNMKYQVFEPLQGKSLFKEILEEEQVFLNLLKKHQNIKDIKQLNSNSFLFLKDLSKELVVKSKEIYG